MNNNTQTGWRIDSAIKDQFEAVCDLEGLKYNRVVETLLLEYIKRKAPK